MASDRKKPGTARRVVVKVGTGVVTRADGRMALGRLGAVVEQIDGLLAQGRQVLLVSSGAVGLGADKLGWHGKPERVVDRQACAAVGQGVLMAHYDALFSRLGRSVAQVLLTEDDFKVRRRHTHLRLTLERLLELGTIPVLNENDTVSTAEIAMTGGSVFGDNDRLSALVASGMDADLLVLLTDVDGVWTGPPGTPGAERVPVWQSDRVVEIGAASARGRGGMSSKIEAALLAAKSGADVVVASADRPCVLTEIVEGADVGTLFPAQQPMRSPQRWLAQATVPAGRVWVDDGAHNALVTRGASLLAPGVVRVEGRFVGGDVVSLCDRAGVEFARGLAAVDAEQMRIACGQPGVRGKAIVHRDHVVIFTTAKES